MPRSFRHFPFACCLPALLSLAACKKDLEKPASSLDGTWQLTNRQCYCVPAPTPDEQVKFAGTDFFFYKNGLLTRSGTYSSATVSPFCGGSPAAGLRFSTATGVQEAVLTLTGSTLTLDYGGPCDAPVDTYQRLP